MGNTGTKKLKVFHGILVFNKYAIELLSIATFVTL